MEKKDLSLWAAFDAIEELSRQQPCWIGTPDELIDVLLEISGTTTTPARRKWLIEELSWGDGRRIMRHRDVILEVIIDE